MAANHGQGVGAPNLGELDGTVGLMLNQVGGGQALEAVRNRRNAQAHTFGQRRGGGGVLVHSSRRQISLR